VKVPWVVDDLLDLVLVDDLFRVAAREGVQLVVAGAGPPEVLLGRQFLPGRWATFAGGEPTVEGLREQGPVLVVLEVGRPEVPDDLAVKRGECLVDEADLRKDGREVDNFRYVGVAQVVGVVVLLIGGEAQGDPFILEVVELEGVRGNMEDDGVPRRVEVVARPFHLRGTG
jgi:hypothetical protein